MKKSYEVHTVTPESVPNIEAASPEEAFAILISHYDLEDLGDGVCIEHEGIFYGVDENFDVFVVE